MERPLQKRTKDADLGWMMSVQQMSHATGLSYPVFEWSFGRRDGLRGGELCAWSLQGTFVFEDRRAPREMPSGGWKFLSVEDALSKIDEYGWGEPPHIDEVFRDVVQTRDQFPVGSKEAAEQIFNELTQKWETLLASQS